MTSFLRISAMLCDEDKDRVVEVAVVVDCDTEAAFKRSLNPTALLPHHTLHKLFPSYNPDCRASAALPRNSSTAPLSLSTTYVLALSRRRGLDSKAVLFIRTQHSYTRIILQASGLRVHLFGGEGGNRQRCSRTSKSSFEQSLIIHHDLFRTGLYLVRQLLRYQMVRQLLAMCRTTWKQEFIIGSQHLIKCEFSDSVGIRLGCCCCSSIRNVY